MRTESDLRKASTASGACTIKTTAANQHDVTVTSELLTGEEKQVYGDSGYLGADKRPETKKKNIHGKRIQCKINRRPSQSKNNSARSQSQIKRCERKKSSVRVKVEHVFAVVKLQLRFRKTRYRGLLKQIEKMNMIFALANMILTDSPCLAAWVSAPLQENPGIRPTVFMAGHFFLTHWHSETILCGVAIRKFRTAISGTAFTANGILITATALGIV